MMWRVSFALLLAAVLVPSVARAADGQKEIVADVSSRQIEITPSFDGASATLFGALPESGDVILTVTGPALKQVAVRRKEKVFGVWINRSEVMYSNVPGFYWLSSSRPLADMVPEKWLATKRIGPEHFRFTFERATRTEDVPVFQNALIGLLKQGGLYASDPTLTQIMGGRLYRADLHLPDDAPTGDYKVVTYLLKQGQPVEEQAITLTLKKSGTMAGISVAATEQPVFYGIFAILLALLSGWISAFFMQRR